MILLVLLGMLICGLMIWHVVKKKGCDACEYNILNKCQLGGTLDPKMDVYSCELREKEYVATVFTNKE
jgi:hypothetical protein